MGDPRDLWEEVILGKSENKGSGALISKDNYSVSFKDHDGIIKPEKSLLVFDRELLGM